ncbi:phenylacetyl-CoA ligase [Mycena metata]|uniref:Phenylacetyl-CoA ligase n=1 Tax=Mycena metata TaxID=1033252 RepID=A0AAD7GUW8_9AGAR|nr:phenylacetyl-CoA ligase [Mycena metata]
MTEFRSEIPLPEIPADLTVAEFLLDDYVHPIGEMRRGADDVWFIDDTTGRKFTFSELKTRSSHLAVGLAAHNIKENDVVLFFSPNHVDYVVATWAFHRLGAIIATANPMYTTQELINLLEICQATKIVTDERFLRTASAAAKAVGIPVTSIFLIDVSENWKDVSSDNISISLVVSQGETSDSDLPDVKLSPGGGRTKAAFIFFSSGTTGKSKAIMLSHYAVIANMIQMAALQRENGQPRGPKQWALLSGDVVTGLLPFFHVYGLIVNVYWACFLGLVVDIFPQFSLSSFLASITRYHISHLFLVPPHVVLICKDPSVQARDYSHVKLIFTGGASLSVTLMNTAKEIFPNVSISQGYGMSELIIAAIQSPLQRINDGSCGPMLPGFVAKVLKSDGSYGGPGETGELVMTGPSIGMGYLGDEAATKATFVDSWVHSGDEVRFSESGNLFIVDRLKELIKVRGFQVAPAEIEDHLMAHPFVADACVVPFPDEYSGEIPLAFIVPSASARKLLEDGEDEVTIRKEIQKHVSDHKIKEKWLTGGVRFIDAIPKSPSGKILRRILRDRLPRSSDVVGRDLARPKL